MADRVTLADAPDDLVLFKGNRYGCHRLLRWLANRNAPAPTLLELDAERRAREGLPPWSPERRKSGRGGRPGGKARRT